jgi:hypothetical protein
MGSTSESMLKKSGISDDDFSQIMAASPTSYQDYPNQDFILMKLATIISLVRAYKNFLPKAAFKFASQGF